MKEIGWWQLWAAIEQRRSAASVRRSPIPLAPPRYAPHADATFCTCGRSHDPARCPELFMPTSRRAAHAASRKRGGRAGRAATNASIARRRVTDAPAETAE